MKKKITISSAIIILLVVIISVIAKLQPKEVIGIAEAAIELV